MLTGGPLEKKEVRGLTVVEMQAFAVAMGLSDVRVLQPMGFSKLPCKRDKLFVVCESWFDTHDGPFVLSEDRAGELRLKWPDAEAQAALLPEKQKHAPAAPLPPPDAETWKRFEACGARVGLPSRPLIHHDRRHKRSKPTSDAGKKGAKSITEFQKRDPASTSFESIDRRSF